MFNAKWKLLALVLDAIAHIREVFSLDVLTAVEHANNGFFL